MLSTWTRAELLDTLAERGEFPLGFVGVDNASRGFFGRSAADLSLPQAALLGSMIGESRIDPWCQAERAAALRRRVLERMRDNLAIDDAAMDTANRAELGLAAPPPNHQALRGLSYALRLMTTLAAIAIAPLAAVPVLARCLGPGLLPTVASAPGRIVGPALVVAYPMVMLFGLPMHLALVHQRCTRWRDYAIAGILLGAVPVTGYYFVAVVFEAQFVPAAIPSAAVRNLEWGAIGVGVFGLCSAAIAITFRMIAIRQ